MTAQGTLSPQHRDSRNSQRAWWTAPRPKTTQDSLQLNSWGRGAWDSSSGNKQAGESFAAGKFGGRR
eukprot:13856211-Alexandrium_andersonii.AAC.1